MKGKVEKEQSKIKFSLVNPDLRGLWSCSHLKRESGMWWDKILGGLVLLSLTLSWSAGTFLPFFVPWFIYRGGNMMVVGVVLAVLLAWPFVFKINKWSAASRFWLKAAYYFGKYVLSTLSISYLSPRFHNLDVQRCVCD
jgi:hypothetical protein